MQQITNTHAAKVKSPVLSLAISWLIILGTYFLLRLIFIFVSQLTLILVLDS